MYLHIYVPNEYTLQTSTYTIKKLMYPMCMNYDKVHTCLKDFCCIKMVTYENMVVRLKCGLS